MKNAHRAQITLAGLEKEIKSLATKNHKILTHHFNQIILKRIINMRPETQNIFIKQPTESSLEWRNYFRVAFVLKPLIVKLIKAPNYFSNKKFFSF